MRGWNGINCVFSFYHLNRLASEKGFNLWNFELERRSSKIVNTLDYRFFFPINNILTWAWNLKVHELTYMCYKYMSQCSPIRGNLNRYWDHVPADVLRMAFDRVSPVTRFSPISPKTVIGKKIFSNFHRVAPDTYPAKHGMSYSKNNLGFNFEPPKWTRLKIERTLLLDGMGPLTRCKTSTG